YNWADPANRARKKLTVIEEGNAFLPQSVVINNNSVGALPAGITSANNYYQKSSGPNTIRVGNRMVSITDTAAYTENDGLTVKVYYSATEYTNILLTPPPSGEIVDAGWFLSQNNTSGGVVGTMSANAYMLPGAEKIIPVNSGTENGYAFVEFKIAKPGTIGLYAKTTEGALSEVLDIESFEKANMILYPNPVKGILNIAFSKAGAPDVQSVRITNMLGQGVYYGSKASSIDVSALTNGIYHINIATDTGVYTAKFIKE
ncbi:T9SS type A sorting domain-containing protein, partial [Flavobacterium sp.]|uniref:T9SS type A sorting domain-containing protein n=1 Tax=Flavobacterium sp. TaxID=239 RepID=UPI0040332F6B